ncbi:pyrroloquinoline quinone biosynthesis protein PqqE [Caldimonas tepidiphila]|uniref:pyrroloquinoline quinone biosynthesis protein PqqE n=1 Tax=Caldimonas tepidiphila TaxID=2315841 RepID=UPI000E5B8A4E|nr:pyrroloquinoline quinone biosynthesis protein PqqE [Caldimonas tepidiphila]
MLSPPAQAPAPGHAGPPLWLLAELTYRCPLHCAFCYNPVDFANHERELDTAQWRSVLRQARALGSVQCGFSGGEPLLREDLELLVGEARWLGFYTNLITSGVGLTDARLDALREAGLDHVQLSFQDSTREVNDFLSSTRTFDLKRRVAAAVRERGIPMVMNCVVHRLNIDHVDAIVELALECGASYLEFANVQMYSWAQVNREHLLPTRAQIARAEAAIGRWRERLGNRLRIFFVVPDYHAERPKKCMNGWGNVFLTVTPDGTALPCHTARMLPGLAFPNVVDTPLEEIWHRSEGFSRYRGTAWMKAPCRDCDEREKDLGGCRCQAYMLAQDPAAADPVCAKSPQRAQVDAAVARAEAGEPPAQPIVFRSPQASRALGRPF